MHDAYAAPQQFESMPGCGHHGPFSFMAGRGRHHGRHRGGPGPGGGPPFGLPGFGPFGGGRGSGRRGPGVKRGDVRTALLLLLAEERRNGYQLMQEIEERSGGVWRPSPGSVYPALSQLEDEGLVSAEAGAPGKVFTLSEAGRAHVDEQDAEAVPPWDAVSEGVGEETWSLRDSAKSFWMAVMQVHHVGTPAQQGEAKGVLDEARRKLYAILSDDDPAR